jgi:hypothetical protein
LSLQNPNPKHTTKSLSGTIQREIIKSHIKTRNDCSFAEVYNTKKLFFFGLTENSFAAMAVTSSPADSNGKEVVEKSQANCPGVRVVGGRIYDSQNGKTCHQVMSDSFDRILDDKWTLFFFVFSLLPV